MIYLKRSFGFTRTGRTGYSKAMESQEEPQMSFFDLSVLGIVALIIILKLVVLAGAAVLAARMLAGRAAGHRLAWAPNSVLRAPDRPRSSTPA
jgi:hypothetical protein